MSGLEVLKKVELIIFGCGITYAKTKTIEKEYEITRGVSLYLFHRQRINLLVSNTLWTDDEDKPYTFHWDKKDRVFFIRKLAIGFPRTRN